MSLRSSGHEKRNKESGTPADAGVRCPHASGVRDAPRSKAACAALRLRARSPAGVPPRFSPEGLSSPGLSVGPGFPKGDIRERTWPHAPPVRSQRCTSRAGRIAGRHDARAARVRTVSFRPRAPHSLRRRGVPSPKASFNERDWWSLLSPFLASQRRLNFAR